jgi:RNA-directed DNA polymerase
MELELTTAPDILKQKFHLMKNFDDLADLLEIESSYLKYILYRIPLEQRYTTFQIPKRNKGEFRTIANPIKPIKVIQQKLWVMVN